MKRLQTVQAVEPRRLDAASAAHLLSRAGFGATPEELDALLDLPVDQAVASLLDTAQAAEPPRPPDWVRIPWVNTERRFADTPREESAENHRQTRRRYASEMNDLRSWWLGRMITTDAPLREVMTLFWHGHFTSANDKVGISQAMYEQNATLRQFALGNFRELLGAISRDAAMMMYLDLEDSDARQPNENYARELFELFTLGIGHYTERDIQETARALTGWTLDVPPGVSKPDRPTAPDTPRNFSRDGLHATFVPDRHDDAEKTVFGRSGRFGLDEVLDLIVSREETGLHLASRLIDFFGAADPAGTLRNRLASAFRGSGFEMRPVLHELFTAPEFYEESSQGTLIKSPVRLLVGACRQLRLEVEPTPSLADLTASMGQALFDPPNVKGWPGGRAWIGSGTLAVRYQMADALLQSRIPNGLEPIGFDRFLLVPRDPSQMQERMERMEQAMTDRGAERTRDGIKTRFHAETLFPDGLPESPVALVDAMLDRLIVTPVRPTARKALIRVCQAAPIADRPALVVRLILASPEFQMA
ncbi:DUF1800 domain-containing protein [Tautonia marina]|uniref:DUF1800 domain-containing protein n=1 Tax=Tautonia marina TaxID=2653855 RepID=UPI0012607E90|nr:DUF1800 domain-containing protein [Tautonia marina]